VFPQINAALVLGCSVLERERERDQTLEMVRGDEYFVVSSSDGVLLYPMHYSLIQICHIIYKHVCWGEIHSWELGLRLINKAKLLVFCLSLVLALNVIQMIQFR